MLHEKVGKTWHGEQRSLSGDSKLIEQTLPGPKVGAKPLESPGGMLVPGID